MIEISVAIAQVRLSGIAHATEDPRKIVAALSTVCSEQEFHPKVERIVIRGHFGNMITKVDFLIPRLSAAKFFQDFWNRLPSLEQERVFAELTSRLDDEGVLHLRIDKQDAFLGKMKLRDQDPIKMQVAFRSASKSTEKIKQYLESIVTAGFKRLVSPSESIDDN